MKRSDWNSGKTLDLKEVERRVKKTMPTPPDPYPIGLRLSMVQEHRQIISPILWDIELVSRNGDSFVVRSTDASYIGKEASIKLADIKRLYGQ